MHELDVGECLGREFDGLRTESMGCWPATFASSYLVEAIFTSIADIDNLDDFGGQSQVEDITLVQLGFEIGRTSKDQASHVDFVIGDEVLNS